MTDTRWWFVSDLHLDPEVPDSRRTAEAFAAFLGNVVLAVNSPGRHLVLLGDTFNLPGLEAIADRWPDFFALLRVCVTDGVRLDFVCGNHDSDLARAPTMTELGRLAGRGPDDDRVRVHPWILYEPGVFYAEHGHQHHAVHRQPTILGTEPLRTPLAAWTEPERRSSARAGAVLRAAGAVRRAERAVSTPQYASLLADEAARIGLPAEALGSLAKISRFRPVPAAAEVAGRVLARSVGRGRPGTYLESAAMEVHRTLTDFGCAVPWYLFGHTHSAVSAIVEGTDSRYINTGTWSADVRGRGPDIVDRMLFPVAVIANDGSRGHLRYWRWSSRGQRQSRLPSSENSSPSLTTKRQR